MTRRRQTAASTRVDAVLRAGELGAALRVLDLCGVMEEEISRRWRTRAEEPPDVMLALFPTRPVRTEVLYRAHCAELVERIATGGDVLPLTRAEVLGLLSEASLRHPLSHRDAVLMESLAREILPRALPDSGDVHGPGMLAEVAAARAEWLARRSPERASR